MSTEFAPVDDPEIACEVRLWFDQHVIVFVNPRNWKQVSIVGGVSLLVKACELTFPCRVANVGEHHRSGRPKEIGTDDFNVPNLGDYPGTARIDWPSALPDLLRTKLEGSAELTAMWQTLSCEEMRSHLSTIFRARNPGAVVDRQLALIRDLCEGSEPIA